jgi:hypothetical protein
MKIIYILLIILLVIACKTNKPVTGIEHSFFQQLKASVSVTYINKTPIYKIYTTNTLFLTDLEKHLFTYQQQKIDVNEVLKYQTISFLENCIGKPSYIGDHLVEYYLLESCLASKSSKCNKIVVKFDKKTKHIIYFDILTAEFPQFTD